MSPQRAGTVSHNPSLDVGIELDASAPDLLWLRGRAEVSAPSLGRRAVDERPDSDTKDKSRGKA